MRKALFSIYLNSRPIFLLLFVLILPQLSEAQQLNYTSYTIDQGIPAHDVYDALEDNKGYLWLATGAGICFFDGKNFTVFTVRKELSSAKIIKIDKDQKGFIYFLSSEGTIDIYNLNRFFMHPQNINLRRILQNETVESFYIQNENEIYILTASGKTYFVTNNNVRVRDPSDFNNACLFFTANTMGFMWGVVNKDGKKRAHHKLLYLENDSLFYHTPALAIPKHKYYLPSKLHSGLAYLSIGNTLYRVKGTDVQHRTFTSDINTIFEDRSGSLWVCLFEGGVQLIRDFNDTEPQSFFTDLNIVKIIIDREGSFWFISDFDGIYQVLSVSFRVYPDFSEKIDMIRLKNGQMIFYTATKGLFGCEVTKDGFGKVYPIVFNEKQEGIIEDILIHTDGSFWILRSVGEGVDRRGAYQQVSIRATAYMLRKNENSIEAVVFKNVEGPLQKFDYFPTYGSFKRKLFNIIEDGYKNVMIKTVDGLFTEQGLSSQLLYLQDRRLVDDISSIAYSEHFNWIGTKNHGLQIFDKSNNMNIYDIFSGLNSNFIRTVFVDQDTFAWVATSEGLSSFRVARRIMIRNKPHNYRVQDGLPSREINDMQVYEGALFMATSQGLMSLLLEYKIPPTPKYDIFVNNIAINDIDTLIMNKYRLPHSKNNFLINFTTISLKNPDEISYKYRLMGFDTNWIHTKSTFARFPRLPAGNYVFQLMAGRDFEEWQGDMVEINLHIREKFTRTTAFFLIVLFGLISLFTLTSYLILLSIARREILVRKMLLSEISSLRSQMNPHFIFNSLLNVEKYIEEDRGNEASAYIKDFAVLLRRVLESSRNTFIKLHEEIFLLDTYLSLQQRRKNNSFSYQINVHDDVESDMIDIPPMLIQPFVENAIAHAFKEEVLNALIKIDFTEINDRLVVVVEDNGIGRIKTIERKNRLQKHKSTGMINIAERIELINESYGADISVNIIDLYDNLDNACGTRIEIRLPFSFYNKKRIWKKIKLRPFW